MAHIANESVRTAFDRLKTLSNDEKARRLAFVRERALLDERSLLKDAHDEGWEQGIEKGIEKGLEQGLEQGIEKGLAQGIEKGLEQGKQQGAIAALRQTATNLIQATRLDDAAIAEITGLSAEDIAALRNKS